VRGAVVKALRLLVAILGAIALVAWFLLLRPSFLGGPASYVMVSGESMEPTLDSGDLVLTRSHHAYAVGDLVAFRVPEGEPGEGAIVIHRIVRGSAADGFATQGDNNGWMDPWVVGADDIVGERWLTVAGAGRSLAVLRAPAAMAAVVAGVAVFLVLIGGAGKKGLREVSPAKHPRRPRLQAPPRPTAWLIAIWLAAAATHVISRRL